MNLPVSIPFLIAAGVVVALLAVHFMIGILTSHQEESAELKKERRALRARKRGTHCIDFTESLRIAAINGLLKPGGELLVFGDWPQPGPWSTPDNLPALSPEEASFPAGTRLRIVEVYDDAMEVQPVSQ